MDRNIVRLSLAERQAVSALIRQTLDLIKAHQQLSMELVQSNVADAMSVSIDTVRGWTLARGAPGQIETIESFGRMALELGKVDEKWLRSYLRSYGLLNSNNPTRERLFDALERRTRLSPMLRRDTEVEFGDLKRPAYRIVDLGEIATALKHFGIDCGRPVFVIVGGADALSAERSQRVRLALEHVVLPMAEQLGAVVIDGATNSGVIALNGSIRSALGFTFPLLGVAVRGTIQIGEGHDSNRHSLERNHTHFAVVPGDQWGDECVWITEIARAVAGDHPSVTIVANGGLTTWKDAMYSMAVGRPVIALEGSGRTADDLAEIARHIEHGSIVAPSPIRLAIRAVPIHDETQLRDVIRECLSSR